LKATTPAPRSKLLARPREEGRRTGRPAEPRWKRSERGDKFAPTKAELAEKARVAHGEKPVRAERTPKTEKATKPAKAAKSEKAE
jgi:hypothetical protein